jgi:hypothetical protein
MRSFLLVAAFLLTMPAFAAKPAARAYAPNSEWAKVDKSGKVTQVIVCTSTSCQARYKREGWIPAPSKVGIGYTYAAGKFSAPKAGAAAAAKKPAAPPKK